jgi:hypothetical protein
LVGREGSRNGALSFLSTFVLNYRIQAMASVNRVYSALKDLVNKDQRGFVTPAVFNNFAQVAQMNIYNDLFAGLDGSKIVRLRNADPKSDKSTTKRLEEDLSTFIKRSTISKSNGVFEKPVDMARAISATSFGSVLMNTSSKINIPIIYDPIKIDYMLLSELSMPTERAPVAAMLDDIEVYPTTINKIILTYYKQPQGLNPSTGARTTAMPRFGYTIVAGKEIYSAANSVDFELPEQYFAELVVEIAKLIGVNLRDTDVYTYANQEKQPQ